MLGRGCADGVGYGCADGVGRERSGTLPMSMKRELLLEHCPYIRYSVLY